MNLIQSRLHYAFFTGHESRLFTSFAHMDNTQNHTLNYKKEPQLFAKSMAME